MGTMQGNVPIVQINNSALYHICNRYVSKANGPFEIVERKDIPGLNIAQVREVQASGICHTGLNQLTIIYESCNWIVIQASIY
jgi:hypothetical protein